MSLPDSNFRRTGLPLLFWVAMAGLTSTNCVIPIGPQFQDPLAAQNYAPVIVASKPPKGTIVMGGPANSAQFSVTITDPNVGDTLWVRWMANYPEYKDSTRKLAGREEYPASPNGTPWSVDVVNVIDCSDLASTRLEQNQISVTVADRAFLDRDHKQPLLVGDEGKTTEANWTFFISCSP